MGTAMKQNGSGAGDPVHDGNDRRLSPVAAERLLGEVDRAGGCVHPVRLVGATFDGATGELWEGTVGIACKDRRAAVCPACAARYRGDAWHLLAAGLRGGKGIPETVATHPLLFVTLTAPSFGPVHAVREGRCRPRRGEPRCPHGVGLSCTRVHAEDDPVAGEPLCPACVDYEGAVLWNACIGRLWDRTTLLARRGLARAGGRSVRAVRDELRLSYAKVAELQRRGLVHLHAVIRADGPDGPTSQPPGWVEAELLAGVVRAAAEAAQAPGLGGRPPAGWGRELDVAVVDADGTEVSTVASYLAGYVVKGSESSGALARRLRSLEDLEHRRLRPHVVRLVTTAWELSADRSLRPLRLAEHAHTFGYRGHFATTSRSYSTTFGALRAARTAYRRPAGVEAIGPWRYVGRGYADPSAARLAEAFVEAERARRRSNAPPLDVAGPAMAERERR